jgi:hypothetical protein
MPFAVFRCFQYYLMYRPILNIAILHCSRRLVVSLSSIPFIDILFLIRRIE